MCFQPLFTVFKIWKMWENHVIWNISQSRVRVSDVKLEYFASRTSLKKNSSVNLRGVVETELQPAAHPQRSSSNKAGVHASMCAAQLRPHASRSETTTCSKKKKRSKTSNPVFSLRSLHSRGEDTRALSLRRQTAEVTCALVPAWRLLSPCSDGPMISLALPLTNTKPPFRLVSRPPKVSRLTLRSHILTICLFPFFFFPPLWIEYSPPPHWLQHELILMPRSGFGYGVLKSQFMCSVPPSAVESHHIDISCCHAFVCLLLCPFVAHLRL